MYKETIDSGENRRNGVNAGYPHFLNFLQCFQMPCSHGIVWDMVKSHFSFWKDVFKSTQVCDWHNSIRRRQGPKGYLLKGQGQMKVKVKLPLTFNNFTIWKNNNHLACLTWHKYSRTVRSRGQVLKIHFHFGCLKSHFIAVTLGLGEFQGYWLYIFEEIVIAM